ncbi:calcium ion-binding protein [Perilla frutescens var. hirtella]|nr:calcium ion-binding protein [Perilla frutescens var. hirtella]
MLGRSPYRGGSLRPENCGQNALATIASLCFSVFVIGVLIFTIISVAYQPQDPFFPSSSKMTKFLSSDSNPTFKSDSGVVRTGEDLIASDQTAFSAFINVSDVESAVMGAGFEEFTEIRDCRVADPINCRDLEVFHLLMRAAIEEFSDVHFYKFGKPVEGDNSSSCHMAWRFRPKEGKVGGFNKDYRSFRVVRSENCTLSVVGIGEYHSGGNARKRKVKGKIVEKVPATAMDNLDIGETVNDALPTVESEGSFSEGKYLIYAGGGDRCKSMNQYLWSFMCMLGEAQFLNRTLVMDLSMCLSKIYSSSGVDEEGKDFRFYFDFEHLKDSASVLDQAQFWSDWNKWQKGDGLKLHLVEDFRVAPMKLAEVKDSLIMRKFGGVEPDNFWYRVCEGEAGSVVQRPWHMIWKSRRLLDVASAIASRMSWDFDGVHVERGEKAKNKKLWPNLGRDTSPKSLVAKLRDKIEDGRNVYIATNEARTWFFDPLKEKYSIHFLDDYRDLWDTNSDWYYETMKLNNGNAVEFDGYMRLSVDSEVFFRGKKQIETFNDLTKDCKDGVNTC